MGFESVACNSCGSREHDVLFAIAESSDERQPPAWRGTASIPVVRCRQCQLVFLSPRYDEARLTAVYQDPQMFVSTIDPEGRSRSIANERPMRVARFADEARALRERRKGGRLLDVGCGLGFFLEALGPDFDAVGLEWSAPVVEMVRAFPVTVVEGRFPQHPFREGEFDVVSFHNMLDHLPDPKGALDEAFRLLTPGGLLMLSLVNVGGVAARVYGAGFRLLGANHLYYFTPRTLGAYLRRAGFNDMVVQYPYFGTEFAKPAAHIKQILRDWWALHVRRTGGVRLSPPFYGNTMRVFATKPLSSR